MAKIGNLEVDTIHLGNTALTATVQADYNNNASGPVSVVNITLPEGNPVLLFWTCFVQLSRQGSVDIKLQVQVRRTSGTATTFFNKVRTQGGSTYTAAWNGSIMDRNPGSTPKYDIYKTVTEGSGTAIIKGTLLGMYVKR